MKERLTKLYYEHIDSINFTVNSMSDRINLAQLNGPFCISPTQNYCTSKNKVMMIGQQTNGWEKDSNIENMMSHYEKFNFGEKYKHTPFWSMFNQVQKELLESDEQAMWSNINRYDLDEKPLDQEAMSALAKFDFLISKEIEILCPDVCIFFTGHAYDDRIRSLYPNAVFEEASAEMDVNKLARIRHDLLPPVTLRTYHPKYLRLNNLEKPFLEYIATLKLSV